MRNTALILLLVAGTASAADSPLVALAKRTNRTASKTKVITNQTVGKGNGRVSVASTPNDPPAPTMASTESSSNQQPRRQTTATTPANAADTQTAPVKYVSGKDPVSTARSTDPTVTARSTDVTSTVRSYEPSSSVHNVEVASSAKTVPAQSTAKSYEPQSSQPPR